MALQHRRPGAIQFLLERRDDRGMIVAGVVDAVAGEKIENAAAVGREQFCSGAALVCAFICSISRSFTHCGLT